MLKMDCLVESKIHVFRELCIMHHHVCTCDVIEYMFIFLLF